MAGWTLLDLLGGQTVNGLFLMGNYWRWLLLEDRIGFGETLSH
jgi:hypothetical protein